MTTPPPSLFTRPPARAFLRVAMLVALLAALSVAPGCGRKRARVSPPAPPAIGNTETGVASWYGHPYHGRRTSSGEVYDMEQLTAAHRTLPFGTWVRVHNLDNGRNVEVRINDRGPFIHGRIIDLSRAAARSVNLIGPGTAKVRLEIVNAPAPVTAGAFAVQVGAFLDRNRAEQLWERIRTAHADARVTESADRPPLWRVLVGHENSLASASDLAERLRRELGDAFVVRLDRTSQ